MTTQEIFINTISIKKHRTHNDKIQAFIKKCKLEHISYADIIQSVSELFHVSKTWVVDFYYREGLHKEEI